jgi:hypothetical protein
MWGQGQGDVKEGYDSSKQLTDAHNQKDEFQDQLRASTPESMAKNVPIPTYHPPYCDIFNISMTVMNLQRNR